MLHILTKSQFGRDSQIKRIFILGEGGDGCWDYRSFTVSYDIYNYST